MIQNKKAILLFLFLFALEAGILLSKSFSTSKIISERSQQKNNLRLVPEFEKTAEQVLLTIPSQEITPAFTNSLKKTYPQLLENFPSYTQFEIIIDAKTKNEFEKIVPSQELKNRIIYRQISGENLETEAWAQDYLEPAFQDGSQVFIIPKILPINQKEEFEQNPLTRFETRRKTIIEAFGEEKTKTAPLFFEGGNFQTARNSSGDPLIFVDYDNILDSLENKKRPSARDLRKIAKSASEFFGGTEVAIIGNQSRKNNFIHLDQSVLFLWNNVALVNKIAGFPKSSAARQHKTYKKQLEHLGFHVFQIKTTPGDLKNSRSSLNAIAFFDRQENKKKVIYPVFENEAKNSSEKLSKENLRGKALQVYETLEKMDILPIPLPEQVLFQNNAGFHCVVNVLR